MQIKEELNLAESLGMTHAKAALKKEEPTDLRIWNNQFSCPNCNILFGPVDLLKNQINPPERCKKCGQALIWPRRKNYFIVIEGLDGSGKTTQAKLLAEYLAKKNIDVVNTSEPTRGTYGKLCREVLGGKVQMPKTILALTFTADRIEHNKEIEEFLDAGNTIICDRYYYSTLAYQGMDVGMEWLKGLTVDCQDIRKPDLCIFLDLEPEKSMERITANRKSEDIEIYETLESLTTIRDRFYHVLYSLKDDNVEIIDASGTVEEVAKRIQHTIEMFFNN